MKYINPLKPKSRSMLRLRLGRLYYTYKRYLLWHSRKYKFALKKSVALYPYVYAEHKTPLLRKLKDVDMQFQYNKIINLKLAAAALDGTIVQKGETLSLWRLVGNPSYKRGFVDGMVLFCGTFSYGAGGGLCQMSNLIYWITLHTPLTVTERYRHSFDIFPDSNRTQPFGSGATCIYPYRDLMVTNNINSDYQLHVYLDDEYLYGEWRSLHEPDRKYEVIEKNHMFRSESWGAHSRHNEIYRRIYTLDGDYLGEEYITENHALTMYSPFLDYSGGTDKSKPPT